MIGIPYMGSKRKIAKNIVNYILEHNPKCEYVFDLFGGGGAISFEFLKRGNVVHYNELNSGVYNLLKKIQIDGVTDDFYKWVSRDDFLNNKDRDDWYGGLIKCCWSFGNNQKDYLFGKDVEPIKKAAHDYLFENGYNKTSEIRTKLVNQFKHDKKIIDRFELQQLEQLQQLERLEQLEQLERLQQLQQLERLQQLEQLELTNLSYEDVKIETPIEKTIIYCDIPYNKTAKYQSGGFNHDLFFEWVKNSKYKIYVSEYNAPMIEVKAFIHQSSLSATAINKTIEKLFCNQKEFHITTLF